MTANRERLFFPQTSGIYASKYFRLTDAPPPLRLAVTGLLSRWQRQAVFNAARKHGQIVYWIVDDADWSRTLSETFPDYMSQSPSPAALHAAKSDVLLVDVARELSDLSWELWPSVFKGRGKLGIEGVGLVTIPAMLEVIAQTEALFESARINCVLFGNVPTGVFNHALYLLARRRGIKTLVLKRLLFESTTDLTLLIPSIEEGAQDVRQAYREALAEEIEDAQSDTLRAHLRRIRDSNSETDSTPTYFQEKQKFAAGGEGIFGWPREWARAALNTVYKKKSTKLEEFGGRDNLRQRDERKKLIRAYKELSTPVVFDVPFIYVPLHIQPEASTTPNGGLFAHQHLMVDMLSKRAPDGWQIVVKEHPNQLKFYYPNQLFRSPGYYRSLAAYRNVTLCAVDESPVALTSKARAVATVTGYSGWQAVNWGVPVLAFGHPWYEFCHGVFSIRSESDLREALDSIVSGFKPHSSHVDLFVRVLLDHAIKGHYRKADEHLGESRPYGADLEGKLDTAFATREAAENAH